MMTSSFLNSYYHDHSTATYTITTNNLFQPFPITSNSFLFVTARPRFLPSTIKLTSISSKRSSNLLPLLATARPPFPPGDDIDEEVPLHLPAQDQSRPCENVDKQPALPQAIFAFLPDFWYHKFAPKYNTIDVQLPLSILVYILVEFVPQFSRFKPYAKGATKVLRVAVKETHIDEQLKRENSEKGAMQFIKNWVSKAVAPTYKVFWVRVPLAFLFYFLVEVIPFLHKFKWLSACFQILDVVVDLPSDAQEEENSDCEKS